MEHSEYLTHIRRDAAALARAARGAGPDAAVPSCPDWDVAKLVKHTGTTHRWVLAVLDARGPVGPGEFELALPDAHDDYPEWFEHGAGGLVRALDAEDPDADVWSWGADQHVRFWSRRMADETSVHRWDAQCAAGEPEPIDGALAADGIDEFLDNVAYYPELRGVVGPGDTLHLHCTDREGEWLLGLGPDGLTVRREHAKGDVAIRGTASDLALFLVGRAPPDALEVHGDPSVADRWQAEMRF